MYSLNTEVDYLSTHTYTERSFMMNSTPEDRGSQSPIGTNGTPEDWDRQTQTSNKSLPAFSAALGGKKAFEDKMAKGLTSADLNEVMKEIGDNLSREDARRAETILKNAKTPREMELAMAVLTEAQKKRFEEISDSNKNPLHKEYPGIEKSVEKTKNLIINFKDKLATYPKHLSYDGSVVLCVMLSMKKVAYPDLVNLPMDDQTLIKSLLPPELYSDVSYFEVAFDENKDFILKFKSKKFKSGDTHEFIMFNSVAHPRPEDLRDVGANTVPIEMDGDKIAIGGKIKLSPRTIRIVMGKSVPPAEERESSDPINAEEKFSSKRSVAGRNAYEIRADVLQMALEWGVSKGLSSETEVLNIAKKFYQFVENRR